MFKKIAVFLFAVGVATSYSAGAAQNCARQCINVANECMDTGQSFETCKALQKACYLECQSGQ